VRVARDALQELNGTSCDCEDTQDTEETVSDVHDQFDLDKLPSSDQLLEHVGEFNIATPRLKMLMTRWTTNLLF